MSHRSRTVWTDEILGKASEMWKSGASAGRISAAMGLPFSSVNSLTIRRRDLFPFRSKPPAKPAPKPKPAVKPKPDATAPAITSKCKPDRVPRTVLSGAVITMPRVTFIDGPAP